MTPPREPRSGPPTICQCGLAKSYHFGQPSLHPGHAYVPRYEPTAWREGYRSAIREAEAAGAPLREALVEAMYADGCITPPQTDHVDHVLAALAATPAPAPLDMKAGLAVLDNLKEKAFAYWSEESLKHDYAFHPNVFWAWLDEERARLTARAAATEDMP